MVLSGTLREFILADVFQLLTQQKITGKLLLNNGKNEGFVIFKNGQICYAEKDTEKLSEKVQIYLNSFSGKPAAVINETFSSLNNDIHELTVEIVKKGFLSRDILTSLAETLIEDICCSLFLWKTGSYRFTSIKTVDEFIPLDLTFAVENIVMEAMRRTDEWYRMQDYVNIDTIFVRGTKESSPDASSTDPIKQPYQYMVSRIDGTSPVSDLVKDSCLSEYKVYESLYNLFLDKSITPLSEQYTRSVKAALEQKQRELKATPFSSIVSISSMICTIALFFFITSLLINKVILSKPLKEFNSFKTDAGITASQQNLSVGHLYFRTINGKKAESVEQLSAFKLITRQDIINLGTESF